MPEPLLAIRGLTISPRVEPAAALVRGLALDLAPGELLGLAGESGSGKTLTGLALLGLLPTGLGATAGSIRWRGRELIGNSEREWRAMRGREIALIPQHPMTALNPVASVGRQIEVVVRLHRGLDRRSARAEALVLLERLAVAEPARTLGRYPHELSGGTIQRVLIAMAMACRPRLIIADEMTSALDVTTQATILDQLTTLCRARGTALLLITHDLGLVARSCDRAAVMYCGQVVEAAPVEPLYARPRHPYSAALLAAVPALDGTPGEPLNAIAGQVPDPGQRPPGCAFAPRCPRAVDHCGRDDPPATVETDRQYRCFLPL